MLRRVRDEAQAAGRLGAGPAARSRLGTAQLRNLHSHIAGRHSPIACPVRGRLLRRDGRSPGARGEPRRLWRLGQVDDSLRGVAEEQPRHAAVPAILGHGEQCNVSSTVTSARDRHDRRFERRGRSRRTAGAWRGYHFAALRPSESSFTTPRRAASPPSTNRAFRAGRSNSAAASASVDATIALRAASAAAPTPLITRSSRSRSSAARRSASASASASAATRAASTARHSATSAASLSARDAASARSNSSSGAVAARGRQRARGPRAGWMPTAAPRCPPRRATGPARAAGRPRRRRLWPPWTARARGAGRPGRPRLAAAVAVSVAAAAPARVALVVAAAPAPADAAEAAAPARRAAAAASSPSGRLVRSGARALRACAAAASPARRRPPTTSSSCGCGRRSRLGRLRTRAGGWVAHLYAPRAARARRATEIDPCERCTHCARASSTREPARTAPGTPTRAAAAGGREAPKSKCARQTSVVDILA